VESDEECIFSNCEHLDQSDLPADVAGELEIYRQSCDEYDDEPKPAPLKKWQKRDTITPPKWKKSDRVACVGVETVRAAKSWRRAYHQR